MSGTWGAVFKYIYGLRNGKMNFTIIFTNECNMQCHYCYEKEKKNVSISKQILEKVIEYIDLYYQSHKSEKISVVCHGGEPLLEFDKIKYFTTLLNERIPGVSYHMTTNGTLLKKEYLDFLLQHDYDISVSIDGDIHMHNINRVFKDKSGTYECVVKNLSTVKERIDDLTARMTINSNNVFFLYEGVKSLLDMGFNRILPVPDVFDTNWDYETVKELENQGKRLIEYVRDNKIKASLGLIDDVLVKCKNTICSGGKTSLCINSDGKFYPCLYVLGQDEWVCGDIYSQIDSKVIDFIHQLGKEKNECCVGCMHYDYCPSTRCKILNKGVTDDFNEPSAELCNIENVKVTLGKYYRELIGDDRHLKGGDINEN